MGKWILVVLCIACLSARDAAAQQAVLNVDKQSIKTYPFGDPDPVPILYKNPKAYPYFRFDGFSHTAEQQPWTVVHLENPYIDVTVLPEVGGKVWGAVEKATGNEFIYKNEVLKFRDIAVRGAWTSGGIEYNFSVYGHSPTVATPVDYVARTNEDGSASVVIGATDWTSRTLWRVTMTVPKDKAYLQIDNLWFNPTPLNGLWYHWLNVAAEARHDLQFFFPGNHYIGHGGDAHAWPIDEQGRDLSYYRNNDFGGSKSYHVLGRLEDYYGGYWHDLDFGFGHWAPYADAPGKKIWIWSLSRSGAIWEDLLTDTDGQYVEVQAGWKFNQTDGLTETPFAQTFFPPYAADRWTETYFPVKGIGGMVDASRHGVLNVTREGSTLEVAVNALQRLDDSLTVALDGRPFYADRLVLEPMEVAQRVLEIPNEEVRVTVTAGGSGLHYESAEADALDRPLRTTVQLDRSSAIGLFREAENLHRAREFERALQAYLELLEKEPAHDQALGRVAEMYYRRAEYEKSLRYASTALEIDTYDPYANFIYGVAQWRSGDPVNAIEALGWAARSPMYRSGAYVQMAVIYLQEDNFEQAAEYAQRALRFNELNLGAHEVLAVSYRKRGRRPEAQDVLSKLLEIDPLSHFARFEQHLLNPSEETLDGFKSMIRGELPDETYLELAVRYADAGRTDEAIQVLEAAPEDPVVYYWLAYLNRDRSATSSRTYLDRALSLSPHLVFPFRQETLPVLEWAMEREDGWKTKYYLGTLYWSLGRKERAAELYEQSGDEPDFAPFFLARGYLNQELEGATASQQAARDFQKAVQVDGDEWRGWVALTTLYGEQGAHEEAIRASHQAYDKFPDNYYVGLKHAAALLNGEAYAESARVLEEIRVLPSEGAYMGRVLREQAYVRLAIQRMNSEDYAAAIEHLERSKEWPEHLGVGRPYDVDQRLQDYLEAYSYMRAGDTERACERLRAVTDFTEAHPGYRGVGHYIGALALRGLGQAAQATALLEQWRDAAEQDDLMVRWALASFQGEDENALELARELDERIPGTSTYGLLQAFVKATADDRLELCCGCE